MATISMNGKWRLVETENLDKFLKACGVGMVGRTMASRTSPTVHIKQTGTDTFEIVTKTSLSHQEMSFKVDEVFRGNLPWERGDREMRATWEDGRLVIRIVGDEHAKNEPVFARYLDDGGQLVLAQSMKGVESKRFFQRVQDS